MTLIWGAFKIVAGWWGHQPGRNYHTKERKVSVMLRNEASRCKGPYIEMLRSSA